MITVSQSTNEDDESRAVAQRMHALAYFRLGDFVESRRLGENLIAHEMSEVTSITNIYRYDRTTAARANLSATLWVQGQADRALEMLKGAVDSAIERRNPHSLVYILANVACPIALWSGEDELAGQYIKLLKVHSEANAFVYMGDFAAKYAAIWAARTGQKVPLEFRSIREHEFQRMPIYDRELYITTAPDLIDEATITQTISSEPSWATAEVMRAWGERLLKFNTEEHTQEAARLFEEAIALAERQGALSWELRASMSLARLRLVRGDPNAALRCLTPVLDRFTEGFQTADLRDATALRARLEALV